MRKNHFFILFIFLLPFTGINAQQKKTYDIFSYKSPIGFKLNTTSNYIYFSKYEGKEYCQIFLYPAMVSQADVEKDFTKYWDLFARNGQQGVSKPEREFKDTSDAWHKKFGMAKGTYNNKEFTVTVSARTKGVITYCIGSVYTNEKYVLPIQDFIASVVPDEKKFTRNSSEQNNTITGNTTAATIPPTGIGLTYNSTNFNDGWTSAITNDYVKVSKNGTEVRLYYADAKIDRQLPSNTNSFESYYWDAIVQPAFNTAQPFVREKEQFSYGKEDIWEANVTNKQTGKAGYLGMRLVFNNGTCRPIVVIAPDKNTYYSQFGSDEDFTKMLSYNKFAVAQKDLVGKWKSFEAGSMDYYNIYSGDYAGMSTASTNDEFIFISNGTYQSEHSGTITFNGSVSHGKTTYQGSFSVDQWELVATNRGPNDPGEFFCQFEAVKGGSMLRLTNKKFTGNQISLFKTK